jgi:arylsulfatase A-like enzyme
MMPGRSRRGSHCAGCRCTWPSLFLAALYFFPTANARAGEERPNIILFVADDQGWNGTSVQMDPDIGGSRSDYYQTPNLEMLAERGMRFSRAYSAAPLCQPTRASIQTGMSPARLQYTDNFEGGQTDDRRFIANYNGYPLTPPMPTGLAGDLLTIPRWLDQHHPEYVSAHIGKWHMSNSGATHPTNMGYDFVDDAYHGGDADPWGIVTLTNSALGFMQQRVQNDEPFFLQLSHRAVHTPNHARPESIEMFEKEERGILHADPVFAAMTYDLDSSLGDVLDAVR